MHCFVAAGDVATSSSPHPSAIARIVVVYCLRQMCQNVAVCIARAAQAAIRSLDHAARDDRPCGQGATDRFMINDSFDDRTNVCRGRVQ